MHEQISNGIYFVTSRWPLDRQLPTIIFIHGSGGTNILWDAQVKALGNTMNTIAIDLPGHGKSEGKGMQRVESYSAKVSEFIQSIIGVALYL